MERRDFTINAIARRLETGEILDPLGGRADLERGVLRTTSPTSFRDDPLRIVRGLRFVSQLGFDPDEDTLRQMREWAPQLEHVSGERIGGGLTADGMGELSKLLLGAHPAKALRLARDAGVLLHLLPEFEPAIGYAQQSDRQHLTLDEHVFAVVQAAADAGVPLEVRLATLLHDLGKPEAERDGGDHAAIGAGIAAPSALPASLSHEAAGLRRPTRARAPVRAGGRARRRWTRAASSRATASGSRSTCSPTAPPTSRGRPSRRASGTALERFRVLVEQERAQPHRLADLDVDGADLIAAGFSEGPELGRVLQNAARRGRRGPGAKPPRAAAESRPGARMIRWVPPGPYEVAFSTRAGGVSEGPYESLNLGRMTGDDVERVDENRRRLCAEVGANPDRLALNRQIHSSLVHRAEPGARGEPGDGLWTEEPICPCSR